LVPAGSRRDNERIKYDLMDHWTATPAARATWAPSKRGAPARQYGVAANQL